MQMISDQQRRARLGLRHRLAPDTWTDDVATIADDLVALHSSDPVSVFLSAGLRMVNPSIAAVEHALYEDRWLLRHHAMRRTLWVMTPEVATLAHASSTVKVAAAERRKLLGWLESTVDDPQTWLDEATERLVQAIDKAGMTTTRALGQELPDLNIDLAVSAGTRQPATVAAHQRILLQAAFEGRITRARPLGSWIGSQYRWAAMKSWSEDGVGELDPRHACAELLRLWLARFGPGTTADLRWWTGWTVKSVNTALADIGAVEVSLDGDGLGWVGPGDREPSEEPEPWVALLPGLDPTAMGWKDRAWYLSDAVAARVTDRSGNIGPTVWMDGRVIGGWAQRPDGEIGMDLCESVPEERNVLMDAAVARLAAFLGDDRIRVRFPSPNQAELLG